MGILLGCVQFCVFFLLHGEKLSGKVLALCFKACEFLLLALSVAVQFAFDICDGRLQELCCICLQCLSQLLILLLPFILLLDLADDFSRFLLLLLDGFLLLFDLLLHLLLLDFFFFGLFTHLISFLSFKANGVFDFLLDHGMDFAVPDHAPRRALLQFHHVLFFALTVFFCCFKFFLF